VHDKSGETMEMECGMITPTPNTTEHRTPKTGYLSLSLPLPLPLSLSEIEESISIADIFPPNRRVDIYCRFLPAKSTSRFLLPISSRQIDESISIADFFPP
jgi:hypothetical protein